MRREPPEKKDLSPLGERIDAALKREKLGDNDVNRSIGAQQGFLSKLKYGERGSRVETKYIFALARVLREEAEWLWTGAGPRKRKLCVEEAAEQCRGVLGFRADAIDQVLAEDANAALSVEDARDLMWKESKRLNEEESKAQRLRELDVETSREAFKEKRKADRAAKSEAKKKTVPDRASRPKPRTGSE